MQKSGRDVVIVGAGIGGLAAAIEATKGGARVTVLERAHKVGGKMREVMVAGRAIDSGPTVLTMPAVFERLCEGTAAPLRERVVLEQAEILARHFFPDGGTLDLFSEVERSVVAIEAFSDAKNAAGYLRFSEYARRIYESVREPFIESQRPTFASLLRSHGLRAISTLPKIDAMRSMAEAIATFFSDPRLRQLFARYATYCGSSPYLAPATLNLIAHVERDGVYLVRGGMYRLAEALETVARELGVVFETGAHVTEVVVKRKQVAGARLVDGRVIHADAVIYNGDARALPRGLLGSAAQQATDVPNARSLSAVTFSMLAEVSGAALVRHNVFFSEHYEREFEALVQRRELADDATVYVCAQDRDDHGLAEPGRERLFVIINAPADAPGAVGSEEVSQCRDRMMQRLLRQGLSLSKVEHVTTTPNEFEQMFPASGGALYGSPTHGMWTTFERPSARTRLAGLYLAGGTVHPGAGVPMAATSGVLAAQALLADWRSTKRSRPEVTPGGTSMP